VMVRGYASDPRDPLADRLCQRRAPDRTFHAKIKLLARRQSQVQKSRKSDRRPLLRHGNPGLPPMIRHLVQRPPNSLKAASQVGEVVEKRGGWWAIRQHVEEFFAMLFLLMCLGAVAYWIPSSFLSWLDAFCLSH
jgi:hypothetical protein